MRYFGVINQLGIPIVVQGYTIEDALYTFSNKVRLPKPFHIQISSRGDDILEIVPYDIVNESSKEKLSNVLMNLITERPKAKVIS